MAMESPSRYCRLQIAMTRRLFNRRQAVGFAYVPEWRRAQTRTDRRISGIADRRKEIHAELAELYKRRCDDCSSTCLHSQEAARS